MTAAAHIPVLAEEVVHALAVAPGETHVDGTFGAGGYAKAMTEEFYRRQRELMAGVLAQQNVVITTAAVLDEKCSSHEVWRELGVAYFQASRLHEASAALGTYVQRRPYDPEGLYWRGKTSVGLQRFDEAKESFESCKEAVQTMPPHRRRQVARWQRLASNELHIVEAKLSAFRISLT